MIYGTLTCAKEYGNANNIAEWLQLFLRHDGNNIPFADGLLLEKRFYFGPIVTDIVRFNIEEGAPSYLVRDNDIAWFFEVVDKMVADYSRWDMPPLIVNYHDGIYEVNDGRHRYCTLRKLKITQSAVIFWVSTEQDYQKLLSELQNDPLPHD